MFQVEKNIKKIYKIFPGEYFDFLPYYIEKEELIKDNGLKQKKEKINLWYEAALKLPFN